MKTGKDLISTSKFLSLVLRHQPEVVGMQLDDEGWLDVNQLIANANERGKTLNLEWLVVGQLKGWRIFSDSC